MASAKIVSLAIRTIAKPIATQLKQQAVHHEKFKKICISLAQFMHRSEARLRANLLANGEPVKVRPLNDAKAITNGANAISEGFLFAVAALIILGETYRGSRSRAHERDRVEDELVSLKEQIEQLNSKIHYGQDGEETPLMSHTLAPSILTQKPSNMSNEYLSLVHSLQVLWALAEKNGWMDDTKALPSELKWLLEHKSSSTEDSPASSSDENTSPDSSAEVARVTTHEIAKQIRDSLHSPPFSSHHRSSSSSQG